GRRPWARLASPGGASGRRSRRREPRRPRPLRPDWRPPHPRAIIPLAMSVIATAADVRSLPSSARRKLGAFPELALLLTWVLLVVFGLRTFVVEPYVISGVSMEPTFSDSERLLISKFAPRVDSLSRGDIVIFDSPEETGKRLIKRIVGLPGETVVIQDGVVF